MLNALRKLLVPFSRVYGAIVAARNFFYDRGLFTITAVGTPVISVGNITAGGTGKTPLVEYIVRTILDSGARPAVLSRGYRRTTTGTVTVSDGVKVLADADRAGDEPAQIARKFPGCVVVVDEDRVRGARFLESAFHPDVIVLDDGFQHRALRRDLDIVVVADGAGGSGLLPSGDGREPESSLRRADIVVKNMRAGSGLHGTGGTTGAGGTTGLGATTGVRMRYELKRFASVESGKDVGRDELARRPVHGVLRDRKSGVVHLDAGTARPEARIDARVSRPSPVYRKRHAGDR